MSRSEQTRTMRGLRAYRLISSGSDGSASPGQRPGFSISNYFRAPTAFLASLVLELRISDANVVL